MVNLVNLVNFSSSNLAIGDMTYSAYPLSAPTYLPLNDGEASYLTSSYPALGAIYAPTTVAYSATAITNVPYSSELFQFVFGNNVFLGWNSRGNIITTTDFATWTSSAINTAYAIPATGGAGLYSVDGIGGWGAMAYGRGIFVATRMAPNFPGGGTASTNGSALTIGGVAVSYDNGASWVEGVLPNSTTVQSTTTITQIINWQSIAYGNKFFIANGYSFDNASGLYRRWTCYSPDGLFWSNPNFATVGATSNETNTTNIAYGNGVFVYAVSDGAGSTKSYYTSGTPSITWTAAGALPASQQWFSVAYGAGVFVAVGSGTAGGTTIAASSATGATWTSRTMPASLQWTSVTYANGYFVAIGQSYGGSPATTSAIATSTNGTTWTLQTTVSANSRVQIAGGKGKFVYMENTGTGSNAATVLSLSAAASTFTLPIVRPIPGTQAYIKAT